VNGGERVRAFGLSLSRLPEAARST